MSEIKNGETKLSTAASNAYSTSLKPFHGWVVRGVFAVSNIMISLTSVETRLSSSVSLCKRIARLCKLKFHINISVSPLSLLGASGVILNFYSIF